jgi:hypothetical protein
MSTKINDSAEAPSHPIRIYHRAFLLQIHQDPLLRFLITIEDQKTLNIDSAKAVLA